VTVHVAIHAVHVRLQRGLRLPARDSLAGGLRPEGSQAVAAFAVLAAVAAHASQADHYAWCVVAEAL
jgi:hypothetical protein